MKLFEAARLGKLELQNRVVMAPLTRSRATGNVPNDLMVEYYGQRAAAGLLIAEGTAPSPNGLGYVRIPGLYNATQVEGWKRITSAVHAKGAKMFVQLMHTGRVSHLLNMPAGARVIAPSAVKLSGQVYTDAKGMVDYPVPEAMSAADITAAVKEYVNSARLALEAGFDGVELHAANGYLLEQFLSPYSNLRTDEYGGTHEKRMRFVLEVAKQVADQISPERVGIRISPYGVFNDTGAFEGIDEFYGELARKLSALKLVYIHLVDHRSMGAPEVSPAVKRKIRQNFSGAYILSGGYDAPRAESDLQEGRGDLVAFGRPFISNPSLVNKMKKGEPLADLDQATLYTPGPQGYTTYP